MRRYQLLWLVSIIGSLIISAAGPWIGGTPIAYGSGIELAGYSDFPYKYSGVNTPTADKPQSKLWYNDGFWWASMFNNTNSPRPAFHIYRLDLGSQSWGDTGVEIDQRGASQGDFLWDDSTGKLYVVSGSMSGDGWFFRYGYDPQQKKYTREVGPVVVRSGGGESISLDRDTTGQLWVTFTRSNQVYANRSTTSDAVWGTPFVIPGARSLDPDDISGIVAYRDPAGGKIGVIWSNHVTPSSMYFSYHKDGDSDTTWQPIETIYTAKCAADDHVDIKSIQADTSGTLFAAVKTSFGDSGCGGNSSSPLIRLVVRKPDGTWSATTFGTVGNDHTRPIVLLDTTNRKVYMFATSPTSCGVIYMKSTSMDNPDFSSQTGKGTPFIRSSTYTCINNATSTKQTLSAYTGLVVLAADESKSWYLHNYLSLGTPQPRLLFSQSPGTAQLNAPFAPQPIVTAQNSQGKTDTGFNGAVTLFVKSGTGSAGAALLGTVTRNAVSGVATFTDLSINRAGTGYQLGASASGYTGVSSTAFDITKINQRIAVDEIPTKRYDDPTFTVHATALISDTGEPSGLPVSYSDPSPGDACTVTGSSVQITNVGACTVRMTQSGDATYSAISLDKSFTVQKASQTITFDPIPVKQPSDPPFAVNATASSGLPVSFSALGSCQVTGNVVTLTGDSGCVIRASQAGNEFYFAAPDVSQGIVTMYQLYLSVIGR